VLLSSATSERGTAPQAADGRWVRHVLRRHWPRLARTAPIAPLDVGGGPPLTHTADLWRIGDEPDCFVLKVVSEPRAMRPPVYYSLKAQVLERCRDQGVPVAGAVPTVDEEWVGWHEDRACELSRFIPDATPFHGGAAAVEPILRSGLALRRALDSLPRGLCAELARTPTPVLVDEVRWQHAMDDALSRLLPLAAARTDSWGRAAARALAGLASAAKVMSDPESAASAMALPPAVVHGDLHYNHFLIRHEAPPRVLAILDFDNLHVGDRRLDLAWIACTVARVDGGEPARRDALDQFVALFSAAGLLSDREAPLLMPALIAHAIPVLVDIAKDILERGIRSPAWLTYFDILDVSRMLSIHRLLAEPKEHS
jgi:hypothetical protein